VQWVFPTTEKACERAGLNFNTAKKYGLICQAFSNGDDRLLLSSFDVYRPIAVTTLTPDQRTHLLAQAQQGTWSAARLTKERDALLGRVKEHRGLSIDGTFEQVLDALPKGTPKNVKQALVKVKNQLQHEFSGQVIKLAKEKAKDEIESAKAAMERAKEAEESAATAEARFVAQATPLDGWMTKEEYQLIRGCLHPDRAPEERKEQFTRAFNVFLRMEQTVSEHIPIKVRRARGWA
jgi:hypothetical protein